MLFNISPVSNQMFSKHVECLYRYMIDHLQFKPDDALKGNGIHVSSYNEICILLPGRNWLEVNKLTINMLSLYAIVRDPNTMLCCF